MDSTSRFTLHPKYSIIQAVGILLTLAIVGFGAYSITHEYFKHWAQNKMARALVAFDANELDSALALADEVLAKDPDNVKALLFKATVLAQKGSLEFKEAEYGTQALALAEKALTIEANNPEAWRLIGYSHEIMQQYEEAHAAYARAIEIDPDNPLVIAQDAHAYMLQGNSDKAEAGYRRALALDPTLEAAGIGLARSLAGYEEIDDSIAQYESIVQTSRNVRLQAEAAYSAAMLYRVKDDIENAEKYMSLATTLDSSYALGWMGLGGVKFTQSLNLSPDQKNYEEKKRLVTESFGYLQKAITLNPNQAAAHFQLGIQLIAIGNFDQGIEILEKTKTVVPNDITLPASEKTSMLQRIDSAIESARKMQEATANL